MLEKDVTKLLWLEFEFAKLIEYHEIKYTFEFTNMDKKVFNTHLEFFKTTEQQVFELTAETHKHKDLAIVKIKTLIDDITKKIVDEA